MDSGILLNESINPLYTECARNKADLLVFEIKEKQTDTRYPVAENWFILAPPNSIVVTLWLEEYEKAIEKGFLLYKQELMADGVDIQKIMNKEGDSYLTQHICFQKVIQKRMPPNAKILYHTAEDSMFKIQSKLCQWDKDCITRKLKDKELCKSIPYIKLRGTDREDFDPHFLLSD